MDINLIKINPDNPRIIKDAKFKKLCQSIQEFPAMMELRPIVVNQARMVLGGNMRLQALKALSYKEIPDNWVKVADKLTEEEQKRFIVEDNIAFGEWDWDVLFAEFEDDILIKGGFTIDELNSKRHPRLKNEDDVPDIRQRHTKRGDIYTLGNHRIMCGDSTDMNDIKTLVSGIPSVGMVFTDPPYNVAYQGKGKNTKLKIQNDDMTDAAFQEFIDKVFANYGQIAPAAVMYCCYASITHTAFELAIKSNGYDVRNQIIWVKKVASFGWGDYRWKHEPMFYCVPTGKKSNFYGDRKQYTTWEEEKTDEELLAIMKKMIEKDESGESTVWRFSKDSHYEHPTQKPVELIKKALSNSSKFGATILDLFMGSGSTMIACEAMNRNAIGMEIDPHYCDVIVQRYVNVCQANNLPVKVLKNGEACHDFY